MARASLKIKTRNSLTLISAFFDVEGVCWWLEAGTALAAWRDKALMDWDHDIDVAIWYEDCPDLCNWEEFFTNSPFKVIAQKNLPYLDNIIQLRLRDSADDSLIDIDIYLYKRTGDQAYMRWIHAPVGPLAVCKSLILKSLAQIIKPQTEKWALISKFLPSWLSQHLFWSYLWIHVQTSSCIFHQFPAVYFTELREIELYGFPVCIANDTDSYLTHRYGQDWRQPDPKFNQKGRWRSSGARRKLPLKTLPMPQRLTRITGSC